jgi:hypothetical protein
VLMVAIEKKHGNNQLVGLIRNFNRVYYSNSTKDVGMYLKFYSRTSR